MIDEDDKKPDLPVLSADRRRVFRECLEAMRWEKLMDQARKLLPPARRERRP